MKTVMVEEINKVVIRNIPVPEAKADQLLVKIELSNICSQTDLHMVQGLYDSGIPYPYILGHEAVGTIVQVGKNLQDRFHDGDRVACKGLHGCMAEYAAFPEDALFVIPDSVSNETAVMYEVAACAYALVKQTISAGDKVLLIGQGCSGLLGTIFAKIAGAALVVTSDPSEYKLALSKKYGADIDVNPLKEDLKQLCQDTTNGRGFDAVIDFVGLAQTMNTCVEMMRTQGKIGMFGVNCEPFSFDFYKLHVKAGAVFTAGHEYNYSSVPFRKMLDFTLSGQLKLDEFVSHKLPLEDVQKGFNLILAKDEKVLRIGLVP